MSRRNGPVPSLREAPSREETTLPTRDWAQTPLRAAALCVAVFVALAGVNLTAATQADEGRAQETAPRAADRHKFCGQVIREGVWDVLATRPLACGEARKTVRTVMDLPPVGNAPGSPDGWECARITGAPPSGFQCLQAADRRKAVMWLAGPSGSSRTRRTCNAVVLYPRHGIGQIRTRGVQCYAAVDAVAYWAVEGMHPRGPAGYTCARRQSGGPDTPGGSSRSYTCRRGERRLRFTQGGG